MPTKQIFVVALFVALLASGVSVTLMSVFGPTASASRSGNSETENTLKSELLALKTLLDTETQARKSIEERLTSLQAALTTPTARSNLDNTASIKHAEIEVLEESSEELARAEQARAFREQLQASRASDARKKNLIRSGFAEDEATWILQTESQVQLDSLHAQFDTRRKRAELEQANGTLLKTQSQQLKDALGEDYYERYLAANGLPTSVGVTSVLEGSPGFNSGLKAGDRILSYNGNRVFNIRELNQMTILGDLGKSVLIEIERDGSPQQITLPRGPIGITSRPGRF